VSGAPLTIHKTLGEQESSEQAVLITIIPQWVGGRGGCKEVSEIILKWSNPLVQILVVAARIQMRTFKTEVEKGSVRTVIGHGLVGPKA